MLLRALQTSTGLNLLTARPDRRLAPPASAFQFYKHTLVARLGVGPVVGGGRLVLERPSMIEALNQLPLTTPAHLFEGAAKIPSL
jgi:hypothetical protein